ncbi:unnamed protein product, partial [Acidithrix sp. C25]
VAIKVKFYGTRGSTPKAGDDFATFGGDTSTVVLFGAGVPVILDLGTGLSNFAQELDPLSSFGAYVLLSHFHFDHIQGLGFFVPLDQPGAWLEVHGPNLEFDPLRALFTPPYFPVSPYDDFAGELRFVGHEPGSFWLEGSFARITCGVIAHSNLAFGFRIEMGSHSIAYLPDHQQPYGAQGVDKVALALADDVDLLIHDAQYSQDEFESKSTWGHSTFEFAIDFARSANVKRLAMFHHDPSHNDEYLREVQQRYGFVNGSGSLKEVFVAKQGKVVEFD